MVDCLFSLDFQQACGVIIALLMRSKNQNVYPSGCDRKVSAGVCPEFAISIGLGQGATLVAAFWGVFIWKEFKTAPAGTGRLLAMMFAAFIVGLSLIVYSRLA